MQLGFSMGKGEKVSFERNFLRFVMAGLINTLFGFSVFATVVYFGGETWQALLTGNMAGIFFNFLTIGGFAFRDMSFSSFSRFVMVYGTLFLINLKAIKYVVLLSGHNQIISQAIIAPPIAVLSYFIMKKYVFAKPIKKSRFIA